MDKTAFFDVAAISAALDSPQEPGRVLVDGQVRGYLRWYGDLTGLRGYWPLAEAIAVNVFYVKYYRPMNLKLLDSFAQKQGCSVNTIRYTMDRVVKKAIQLHPDFAAQVLGGFSAPHTLMHFIKCSVQWLSTHRLIHPNMASDDVTWDYLDPSLERRETDGYISEKDFKMIQRRADRQPLQDIAKIWHMPEEMVREDYEQIVFRAKAIVDKAIMPPPEKSPSEWTLSDHLSSIGLKPDMPGVRELEMVVAIVQNDMSLLRGGMLNNVYPTVAQEVGSSADEVARHINKVLSNAIFDSKIRNRKADFYKVENLYHRGSALSNFIPALLRYIERRNTIYADQVDTEHSADSTT